MPSLSSVLALALLAVIALSSAPVQVNALAADRAQVARHIRGHDAVAKRRRDAQSCIPRPSSTPPPTSTPYPTSSPTSAAPTPTPTPTSTGGSKKWGLAFNTGSSILQNFHLSGVGFVYNWSPTLPENIPSGILGIPQLWGANQVDAFSSTVVEGYSTVVFGMNEPNLAGQSNLAPSDAMQLWMDYINPLNKMGYLRVSPACTDDDTGTTWYKEFFDLCYANPDCGIDAIAVHCYNTDIQQVMDYVNMLHNTYNLDVWITEIADQDYTNGGYVPQPDMDRVWDFAGTLRDFVENTSWIAAAAPFGIVPEYVYTDDNVNINNLLVGEDNYPTDLGYFYFGSPV